MNLKPWVSGIALTLAVSVTGCGNTAGDAANAVGNTAGFVANGVGNAAGNLGNAVGNATGLADNRTGTWTGNGTVAELTNAQSVEVDSAKKSVNVRLDTENANNRVPNTARTGGFQTNPMNITIPTGWTVNVIGAANNGTSRALSIVQYDRGPLNGAGGTLTGQPGGTNRAGATGRAGGGIPTGTNFGTTFRATTPGQFAIVLTAQGQRDRVLDFITVSNTNKMPSISSSNRF